LFAGGVSWRGWVGALAMMSAVGLTATSRAQTVSFGSFPNNSTHSNASVMAAIANVPTNAGVVYDPIGRVRCKNVQGLGFADFFDILYLVV